MSRRPLIHLLAMLLVFPWLAPAFPLPLPQGTQAPAKKAKKVWTNEDLEALRYTSFVTTGASERAPAPPAATSRSATETSASAETGEKPATEQKEKEEDPVEKLRKRLDPLRAELDSVEAQLRSFRQARSSGSTTGGGFDVTKAPTGVNTDDQINLLEKRRAELLRQISDIEDEARRKGIAPGAIR